MICECGCGQEAGEYRKSALLGKPRRFIHGHNGKRPILERIFEKVVWNGDEDECWEWQGSLNPRGYGKVGLGGKHGPSMLVHRVVYALFVGSIPPDLTIDHLCRNKRCVNPAHLEPVTAAENHRRWLAWR